MNKKVSPSIHQVMRTPRTVDLEITSRCNLRCKYCYFFDNPEITYKDLPTDEWLKFIEELGECDVMDVCLAGGEPFIREDLPDLIEAIVKNRMRYGILSNGTLIDDEIAELIKKTKRCDYVQVSIDGSCAEIHETGRGKDSFAKAVRGIKVLQKYEIPVTSRITIHHDNIHDLENATFFLLEELKLPEFSTNAAGYFGTCKLNAQDILLTVEDRQAAMETLLKLEKKYPGRITAQAGPLADAHFWTRMEKARKEKLPSFNAGGFLTGCGCPASKIAVRADGAIIPCTMLTHMDLGRINQDPFIEIWQGSAQLAELRERHHIPLSHFEECNECGYATYCTGNCPALAYNLTGLTNQPSPDACLRKFKADGGRIPVVEENW